MGHTRIHLLAARIAGLATGIAVLVGGGSRLRADCVGPDAETVLLSLESVDIEGSTSAKLSGELTAATLTSGSYSGSLGVGYFRDRDHVQPWSVLLEDYADSTSIGYVTSVHCGGQ